ncbi:hypothetical protein ACHAWO_005472 [Cyclotella atomus]|uniref:Uncharacterized protein n=1 Tax=Cyclotella atomus TaxID=382360 RepID=A0ABD3R0Z4_9STRA
MKSSASLLSVAAAALVLCNLPTPTDAFILAPPIPRFQQTPSYSSSTTSLSSSKEEADKLRQKAASLREQASLLESSLNRPLPPSSSQPNDNDSNSQQRKSLKNKRILITGANGRLGSMITRHLLRSHPELSEVIAAVHYIGSATTRGYGRLSYEVGAEDGIGSIGPVWSEDRDATFTFDRETMGGYNLDKLRVVEVELLNPTQVRTITENVDAIIYCATDFEGNRPRAVASLNAALLFRAVADPLKGRVEIEGVRNCLEGLKSAITDRRYRDNLAGRTSSSTGSSKGPTQFVLISCTPDAFGEFETPFGEFNGLKRQSEYIVNEFPSITHTVLQMGRYDERVEEGLEIYHEEALDDTEIVDGVVCAKKAEGGKERSIWDDGVERRINRRDAARAAVEALLDDDLENRKVQCYTYRR